MLYLFAVFLVHRITTCVLKWGISSFIMSKIQLCFRGNVENLLLVAYVFYV